MLLKPKPTKVISSCTGVSFTCTILDTGLVKCFGLNDAGQLGLNSTKSRGAEDGDMGDFLPYVELGTGRTATNLACGNSHVVALLDNGRIKAWGSNQYGQLGYGDTNNRGNLVSSMGENLPFISFGGGVNTVLHISAGSWHTCAVLTNNTLGCWGLNSRAQLGLGDTNNRLMPTLVNLGSVSVSKVACGAEHTCALTTTGAVKCVGSNNAGQLGISWAQPPGTSPSSTQGNVYSTYGNRCGSDTANDIWGDAAGEIGANSLTAQLGGITVDDIAAGGYTTCVLSAGRVMCFGSNSNGQLGVGSTTNSGSVTVWTRSYTTSTNNYCNNLYASWASTPVVSFVNLGSSRTALSIGVYEASACAGLNDST